MRYVELVNRTALDQAIRKHRETVKWLSQWSRVVSASSWRNLQDVRAIYPSADGVKLASEVVVTVFNIKGNRYRLLTVMDYNQQRVYVAGLLTHAEYSKDRWKELL